MLEVFTPISLQVFFAGRNEEAVVDEKNCREKKKRKIRKKR